MTKTKLNKWYYDKNGVYTRDSWTVPEEGAEIWCTGWESRKLIKTYGDTAHILVDGRVYHCDEFMERMDEWVAEGSTWGIEGVNKESHQYIYGEWERI